MSREVLPGLRPDPIQTYLAALGLLRAVAEQRDPDATLHLTASGFVLDSQFERRQLVDFLVDQWVPTPLVSPWNKGSGLRPDGSAQGARRALGRLQEGDDPRLDPYREAVAVGRRVVASFDGVDKLDKVKDEILQRCRARLPDAALDWLDASVVLTTDGEVYPLLLGTGGNLGRMDLTANAYERLDDVIGLAQPADRERSVGWLTDLLLDESTTPRVKGDSPGQFEPAAVGGVNSTTGDGGDSFVNPWGFILALEGALLFASLPVRRLSGGHSFAAVPFSVRADGVGAAGVSDAESLKGELWLPLWDQPATLRQLRRLFGEGRLQWGRSAAGSAVDAARAIASLGADRGVAAFARYTVAERLGQSTLVVPLERYEVRERSSPAVEATRGLDLWVGSLRRLSNPPTSISRGLRRYDDALLRLSRDEPEAGLRTLESLAALDAAISYNDTLRADIRPLPWLPPTAWLDVLRNGVAEPGGPELDLAFSAASAYDHTLPETLDLDGLGRWPRGISVALRHLDHRAVQPGVPPRWADEPRIERAKPSDPVEALAQIHLARGAHAARQVPATSAGGDGRSRPARGAAGAPTRYQRGRWASAASLVALAEGRVDVDLLGRLLSACSILDPRPRWETALPAWRDARLVLRSTEAVCLVHLLPHQDAVLLAPGGDGSRSPVRLLPGGDWPSRLARGDVGAVVAAAGRRLDIAGVAARPGPVQPRTDPRLGRRLLAALLIPTAGLTALRALRAVVDPTRIDRTAITIPEHGAPDA